jgi:RNA polymerase sigma-70 factor (ECF subfamily)
MRGEDFERLYEEHAVPLLNFVLYRTGNRSLAEDIVADTFEKAYRARRTFTRLRASEKTWLYTIALNSLRDSVRRSRTEAKAMEDAASQPASANPTAQLEQIEDRDMLGSALAGLSSEEQEAIALRYGAALSLPEIAKLTGVRLSTAHGRVYGALRKLRDELRTTNAA